MSRKLKSDPAGLHHDRHRRVELGTPDGVPLDFRVATGGERFGAFLLDILIIYMTLLIIIFTMGFFFGSATLQAVGLLLWFALTNFYFPVCEYRWGASLGKRALGTRVVDRSGAPLGLPAILARNFMRDIEFWIPTYIMFAPEAILGDNLPPWVSGVAFLWALALTMVPLFNRRRLRLGDYIGGTMVVLAPKPKLLGDLARRKKDDEILFTQDQLAIYGKYELQVLEDLLRKPRRDTVDTVRKVARKIKKRIDWQGEGRKIHDRTFLEAFYRAQRRNLEQSLMLGKHRDMRATTRGSSGRT